MAITTALKRSSLDDAWDAAKAANQQAPDLRAQLRANEKQARSVIAGGSVTSIAANRRMTEFSKYGPGEITPTETVELWRSLIDLYDSSKQFMTDCALVGIDPAMTELNGFPDPPPPQVQNPNPVTDTAIYSWMMDHLIAITQAGSDYTALRVGSGMQMV